MARTYIIHYTYKNTEGNHAGMTHLLKFLKSKHPNILLIKNINQDYFLGRHLGKIYAILLSFYLKFKMKQNDKIIFFEYLVKGVAYQDTTAYILRKLKINQQIFGLIHLSGSHLMELYKNENTVNKKLNYLDKAIVFGSSLSKFINNIGFKKEIITTFHYVDTSYYKPNPTPLPNKNLQVICIGNLKRNFNLLKSIINQLPEINFHVLMGNSNLKDFFATLENVKLYPYLKEDEMKNLMDTCDVNLSVMEDTVGSNVITTTMAVGLAQVVSDVGSIRDYCDEFTAFLCKKEKDYVLALKKLSQNTDLLSIMKKNNIIKSKDYSHINFSNEISSLL